jgi:D-arabinose 1-dehydrogenase-like Zn-dependent alcohol dehydrogenase
MQKMRCFHLTGFHAPLVPVDKPLPSPAGTEVVLKVLAAGVCHSDVHIWEGSYDLGNGQTMSMEGRVKFPLTMGHESTGEVVAVGPDAGDVKIGEKYLICSWIGCLQCAFCKQGDEHLCTAPRFLGVARDGGYADHIVVPHERYLIDLKGLDPVAAAPLACSGLTTFSALKKAGGRLADDPIVIVGAGGLGMMAINLVKLMGGKGAVVVELDPQKRKAALDAGAIAAIDPKAADVDRQIREALGAPVYFVLDLVGSGETAALGFRLLDKGGKLVIVGLFGGAMSLSVPMVTMRSVSILGSFLGSPGELRELVKLVQAKGMPATPLDRRSLEAANEALADLRAGKVVGRVVLVP